MRVSSAVALLLSACAALAAAGPVVISGQVQVNEHLRDLALLGNDAQVHLIRKPSANAPAHPNATAVDLSRLPMHYDTLVRQDGRFIFPDVAPGTYLLSLQARWHAFNMYRVDVNPAPEDAAPVPAHDPKADPQSPAAAAAAAAAAARARRRTASQLVKIRLAPAIAGSIETALMQPPLPVPFTLQPSAKLEFFVEPQPFDLMGMLKSPMVLIAVFGGAMVFLMPKLMAGLDPEALKELEASQASMNAKMAAVQSGDIGSLFKDAIENGQAQGAAHASAVKKSTGAGAGAKRRR